MREDCCDLSCFLCFESSQASYIQDESIRLDTFNVPWKELPLSYYKNKDVCNNLLFSNVFICFWSGMLSIIFSALYPDFAGNFQTIFPFIRFLPEPLGRIPFTYMK